MLPGRFTRLQRLLEPNGRVAARADNIPMRGRHKERLGAAVVNDFCRAEADSRSARAGKTRRLAVRIVLACATR